MGQRTTFNGRIRAYGGRAAENPNVLPCCVPMVTKAAFVGDAGANQNTGVYLPAGARPIAVGVSQISGTGGTFNIGLGSDRDGLATGVAANVNAWTLCSGLQAVGTLAAESEIVTEDNTSGAGLLNVFVMFTMNDNGARGTEQ